MAFHVGDNSQVLHEPLCIYAPFIEPKASFIEPKTREVACGNFKTIDNVRVTVPSRDLSDTLMSLRSVAGLEIETGEEHLMEITFDGRQNRLAEDLRPRLPIVIYR